MQSDAQHTLRFKQMIPSRTEELHRIREVVEGEAVRFGFDKETAFRLALAVDEACTNIIKHSYEGNPAQMFDVEITTGANSFTIVLTDQGKGFNPGTGQKLDMKRYFERMRRGGLGLHIMRLVMDDVAYDVTANHMNRLRMVKYLNGTTA